MKEMRKRRDGTRSSSVRILPALPLKIRLHYEPPLISMERTPTDHIFKYSRGPSLPDPVAFVDESLGKDVYEIRDEFFRVETPAQAFELMSAYGMFLEPVDHANEFVLSWTEFQRWQQLLELISYFGFASYPFGKDATAGWRLIGRDEREVELVQELKNLISPNLGQTTLRWLQGYSSNIEIRKHELLRLHPNPPPGNCTVYVGSVVEAILATIYFNELVGVNYKKCARVDCNEIYEERTGHERRYCSDKCAHTQGTRDRRFAAKLAKQTAAKEDTAKPSRQAGRKNNG